MKTSALKGFAQILIILGLFLIIGTGAGGFYLYTSNTKSKPSAQIVSQDVKSSPIASASPTFSTPPPKNNDPTTNWKSYTNSDYSIKYPSWVYVALGPDLLTLDSDYLDPSSSEFQSGLYTHGKGFSIGIKTEKTTGTLQDYLSKNFMSKCNITNTTLGIEVFTKIDNEGCFLGGPLYYLQKNAVTYTIHTDFSYDESLYGDNYQEEAKKGLETVDQILSTFKLAN